MTVEEDSEDFPVGLRVLAVDDDPICLKLLDTLLRKCHYHVTTTSQARVALKMLRENKNRFDLVISDVQMPDMDGFRLLELVGLEMDLPVIMLSANGDPKLVMKGVQHGACDYLVKPVRIEELRNIWQHVIRKKKKKIDPNDVNNQVSPNTDHNRKRKEEEDECEDKENESEGNGTQKKARVVWSIELHRKFVGAVNQLGIEKAVPKRILDMMNMEGLTRENVASHLQKYRIYLKRISQQANIRNVSLPPFASNGLLTNMSHLHNLNDVSSLIQLNSQPKNMNNTIGLLGPSINQSRTHQNYHNNIPFLSTDSIGLSSGMDLVSFVSPLGQSSGILNQKMDVLSNGSLNGTLMHDGNGRPRSNEDLFQGGFAHQGYDPLDELMNVVIKREPDDGILNCEYALDYAIGQGTW